MSRKKIQKAIFTLFGCKLVNDKIYMEYKLLWVSMLHKKINKLKTFFWLVALHTCSYSEKYLARFWAQRLLILLSFQFKVCPKKYDQVWTCLIQEQHCSPSLWDPYFLWAWAKPLTSPGTATEFLPREACLGLEMNLSLRAPSGTVSLKSTTTLRLVRCWCRSSTPPPPNPDTWGSTIDCKKGQFEIFLFLQKYT